MKKTLRNIFAVMAVTPLLVQCATRTELDEVRYQLRIVNKKLEDMKSTTVDQLQKRQALASGQVEQLEQDIMKLRGQLEETYFLNQRLREQNKELELSITTVAEQEAAKREETLKKLEVIQKEKEAQLAELNNKLQLQQESVKAIQEARIKDAERKAREAEIAASVAKDRTRAASEAVLSKGGIRHIPQEEKKVKLSVVAPPVPSGPVTPAATGAQPPRQEESVQPATPAAPAAAPVAMDDYQKGQLLFEQDKYDEALKLFEQEAGQTSTPNSVDARFMMGECLFAQKDFDKAIMQFQKIISQHSDHARAPLAMLKQGMAFEKLSDKDTARVIYRKLIKKHASSPEAAEAQERLNKL
jgi:tol-pal system protein YbgF